MGATTRAFSTTQASGPEARSCCLLPAGWLLRAMHPDTHTQPEIHVPSQPLPGFGGAPPCEASRGWAVEGPHVAPSVLTPRLLSSFARESQWAGWTEPGWFCCEGLARAPRLLGCLACPAAKGAHWGGSQPSPSPISLCRSATDTKTPQARPGQDRTDQDRTGQTRTGQPRPGSTASFSC